MDDETLSQTRRSLHGVAELLLAGPQYRACGDIRLRVRPGGFGTMATPDLRVSGTSLLAGSVRVPLTGTYAEVADAAGLEARTLDDVYHGGTDLGASDKIIVDADAAVVVARAFELGDAALRSFAPSAAIVLWPEHFDIAITLDDVNYGVSPGDGYLPQPYAYVGPHTPPPPPDVL
jgi:hypothetical protein